MPRPLRSEQFRADEVCIVHVVQRCVRRAFLAGVDRVSGIDYSFRKEWIRKRMEALASVFAVDVLAYAVMSNHTHQILRNRPDVCSQWSDQEVAIRWLRVFPGRRLEEHLAEPTDSDVQRLVADKERLAEVRRRLSDISWFMRALCEAIARMANKQDDCSGRFWEGRFKAQPIVDEAGLLACSMYVDLNPVRAAMASSPEDCPHTSAYDRQKACEGSQITSAAHCLQPIATQQAGERIRRSTVDELRRQKRRKHRSPTGRRVRRDAWLSPLTLDAKKHCGDAEVHREGVRSSDRGFLEIQWSEYWALLRWTAKQGVKAAGERVPEELSKVLSGRGIDVSMWRDLVWEWQRYFGKSSCIGRPESIKQLAERKGRHHYRGQLTAAACFSHSA